MEVELTDDQINEICSILRVIDVMRKFKKEWEDDPEMHVEFKKLTELVKGLMSHLTEEQIDHVLEIHKIQAEDIEKKLTRKEKREKKKQNTKPTK